MPSSVTEIGYISIKPDIDLEKSEAWASTLKTLHGQPGFQRLRYGPTLETSELVMLLIDWDSLQSHKDFIASPQYKPFFDTVNGLTIDINLHHFIPSPFPPKVLDTAPCTEFATFYNCLPEVVTNVGKFVAGALEGKGVDGYFGASYGESVEDDVVPHNKGDSGEVEKKKGKAVVLCIGWTSKEKHMEFRESEGFKENIHFLRKGMEGVEMYHVAFKAA